MIQGLVWSGAAPCHFHGNLSGRDERFSRAFHHSTWEPISFLLRVQVSGFTVKFRQVFSRRLVISFPRLANSHLVVKQSIC